MTRAGAGAEWAMRHHVGAEHDERPPVSTVFRTATIQPCLWFNDQAREAMEYYVGVFPRSRIVSIVEYPDESIDPHFEGMSGRVLHGQFVLDGVDFVCLDGGPLFTFTEAVSFVITCADQAEIDHYWEALSHVPVYEQAGWCRDRFGVSWQIIPAGMDELIRRPEQIRVLLEQRRIIIDELRNA